MNKDDKWVDRFRKRMTDYGEPVPENLWKELEKELRRPKIIPIYIRYVSVAAIVVIAVISSVVLGWMNSSSTEYIKDISKTMAEVKPLQDSESDMPIIKRNVTAKRNFNRYKLVANTNISKTEPSSLITAISEKEALQVREKNEKLQIEQQGELKEKQLNGQSFFSVTDVSNNTSVKRYQEIASKGKNQDWEVSISIGNMPDVSEKATGYANLQKRETTMLASIIEADKLIAGNVTPLMEAYNLLVANNVDKDVQSKADHKMPITIGVSLRKNLSERWALESGIIYTQLSSELWSGTERNYYETEQKLHYVGIPLKGICRLWENNVFAIYLSAGGVVEKCVSGKQITVCTVDGVEKGIENVDAKVKELQWSVSSSVGAQVKLIENFGVYLEPGVNYYFKDGSNIQTIRKEHPLNFNLQMGIRFSF